MKSFENVQSTANLVEPIEISESYVIVRTGIKRIETDDFHGYTIEREMMYTKDEYIQLIQQENKELSATVDNILTDVIPSLTQ